MRGVYNIRVRDAVRPLFCENGHPFYLNGCGENWHEFGGWCYRLFPKDGHPDYTKPKGSRSMLQVDEEYVDAPAAKAFCEAHQGHFEMNNSSDIDAVMRTPGWFHHAAKLPTGKKAVWLGKVGSIANAVLTADGEIRTAAPTFKSTAVCKRLPVQTEFQVTQHGCISQSSMYKCQASPPSDAAASTALDTILSKADKAKSFGILFNITAPMLVNRMHIVLQGGGVAGSEILQLGFHALAGDREETRTVHAAVDHASEQVIQIADLYAGAVVVSSQASALPTISSVYFTYADTVQPSHVASCTSSASAPGQGCEMLYDGIVSAWVPQSNPAWVKLEFGSFGTSVDAAEPRMVNRMNVRFTHKASSAGRGLIQLSPSSSQPEVFHGKRAASSGKRALLNTEDGWEEEEDEDFLAVVAPGEVEMDLEFDGGKRETVHVDIGSGSLGPVRGWLTVDGVTIELKGAATTSVKLTIKNSGSVHLSEVMFWNANELTPEQRQEEAKSGTRSLELSEARSLELSEAGSTVQVGGFFSDVWDAIKDAAEIVLMNICLAALDVVQAALSLVQAVFNGIASVLIYALEAAIKAAGPHFFKINELMIGGSFDGLKGGQVTLEFGIDMWLFGAHIGPWKFEVVFKLANIIATLFGKAKDMLSSVFRL